jgi:hypothetical protein
MARILASMEHKEFARPDDPDRSQGVVATILMVRTPPQPCYGTALQDQLGESKSRATPA